MLNSIKSKLALIMILVFSLILSACGGKEEGTNGGASGGKDEKLVIGFSQVGAESEWRTANTESMKTAITEAGHQLKFSDAQQKQENQIKAMRSFITQKVDAIVFSPVVETGFETVLKEAKEAGIPVFLADRSVDIEDDSLWATFLGSDFIEEGKKQVTG